MVRIWIKEVTLGFGGPLLLDGASLHIGPGERIGLVGRNGTGKSTLLRLLAGEIPPDRGEIAGREAVRIGLLPQEVPDDLPGTVYDVVAGGGAAHLEGLRRYRELSARLGRDGDPALLDELAEAQHRLEATGGWRFHRQVETVLSRTGLEGAAEFRRLSAGLKRRVFLARALADDPELLLLDEPTNHLDLEAIAWLEAFLLQFAGTLLFVTHDRAFLQRLATRIVELDRGRLLAFEGDHAAYLARRQALLEAEAQGWETFDRKLAREEAWIRQGVKARRTRNEGRVRALEQLRLERERRRERTGTARIAIQEAERSGRLVVDAEAIRFAYGEKPIVTNFSTTILRGDRVGIIGPNGSGKTTLLRLLLGELSPQGGRIRLGTGLRIAYFDQLRAQLDEAKSLRENVAGGNDTVGEGAAARHVVGYLQGFLFPPDQIAAPVRSLSGGERNRLLLARLFAAPSNVLVLDEPTNDLDTETLELLEERLQGYDGTVLLVSHDRTFLNHVVTSTIALEGGGRLAEYVGGYDDWLRQRPAPAAAPEPEAAKPEKARAERPAREKRRLSFREARELETLPARIEALETEKAALLADLSSPEWHASGDRGRAAAAGARLEALEAELAGAYERWAALDDLAASLG